MILPQHLLHLFEFEYLCVGCTLWNTFLPLHLQYALILSLLFQHQIHQPQEKIIVVDSLLFFTFEDKASVQRSFATHKWASHGGHQLSFITVVASCSEAVPTIFRHRSSRTLRRFVGGERLPHSKLLKLFCHTVVAVLARM